MNILNTKEMGYASATQVSSVTLYIWKHGAQDHYCKFASFNRVVDKKTSKIQIGPKLKHWFI